MLTGHLVEPYQVEHLCAQPRLRLWVMALYFFNGSTPLSE
jgi:hypothetical protein